jgi:hypothetical protein
MVTMRRNIADKTADNQENKQLNHQWITKK